MPLSHPNHIPPILHLVTAYDPATVLDVGVGMGAMGILLRQMLEVSQSRLTPDEWKTRIEGVEIFPAYRNPLWSYAYDLIHEMDVRDFLKQVPKSYDLILCCDVLEHFPRDEVHDIVVALLNITPCLVISTPNHFHPQGACFENDAETHHCVLNKSDFPHLIASDSVGETSWHVCSAEEDSATRLREIIRTIPQVKPRRMLRQRVRAKLRRMKKMLIAG